MSRTSRIRRRARARRERQLRESEWRNVLDDEDELTLDGNRVLSSCSEEHGCAHILDTYCGMLVCEGSNLPGDLLSECVLSEGSGCMSRGV